MGMVLGLVKSVLELDVNKALDAYVVFQGGEGRWWDGFTKRGFRHCWVFYTVYRPSPGLLADRYCSKVEYINSQLDVDVWWGTPEEVCEHFYQDPKTTSILKFRAELPGNRVLGSRGLMTCVSVAKAILGLSCWEVLTPYQLCRRLLYLGASVVKREGL